MSLRLARIGCLSALCLLVGGGVTEAQQSENCRYAISSVKDAGNALSTEAQRLVACADAGNYKNDCTDELRRIRRAHSEYKSVIKDAKTECA